MTIRFFAAVVAVLTLLVVCGSAFEADAARFGGGRSFGGSPGFSRSFPSSRTPDSAMRAPAATRQQQSGAAAAAPGASRGLGMGGIVGGLLAGTLLGSLLSGLGLGGGMLDILLLGLGVYLLVRFLGRRRATATARTNIGMGMPVPDASADASADAAAARGQAAAYSATGASGSMWDALGGRASRGEQETAAPDATIPAGFDQADFLRGAKILYQRMNESWDRRDLADIAEFTTTPFMAEIHRQAKESPAPEQTQILMINQASLLDVLNEAGRETASVYFSVLLRETPAQKTSAADAPVEVREVWHFVRAAGGTGMWKLDGIQQVE
jgi:predicted lipid-binding transport protein (Tim44 family)